MCSYRGANPANNQTAPLPNLGATQLAWLKVGGSRCGLTTEVVGLAAKNPISPKVALVKQPPLSPITNSSYDCTRTQNVLKDSTATWKVISNTAPMSVVVGSAGDWDSWAQGDDRVLAREHELQVDGWCSMGGVKPYVYWAY